MDTSPTLTSQTDAPFPAGLQLGGSALFSTKTGLVHSEWYGEFRYDAGKWFCHFVGEGERPDPTIFGVGDSPREAFTQLVQVWTALNGGVESPTLKRVLPLMKQTLDDFNL